MATRAVSLVTEWLQRRRFPEGITVLEGPHPGIVIVFVPISSIGQVKSDGKTSVRQMTHLKRLAQQELGVELDFRPRADKTADAIESGLYALYKGVFPQAEVRLYTSSSLDGSTDVWIDAHMPKGGNVQEVIASLRATFSDYLEKVGMHLHHIYWEGAESPSPIEVLRFVKVLQPVSPEFLAQHMGTKGYEGIPVDWLKTRLDRLRRNGLILWHREKYALSAKGLSLLPQSRGSVGSDIERALELGRRSW